MFDEALADGFVTFGGIGIVAHHEPLRTEPVVGAAAGADPHLLDPQVIGDVVGSRPGRASAAAASALLWRSFSA